MQHLASFIIIGISVRTTNENGQMAIDIPALWSRFLQEGIAEKIPDKTSGEIYCIYTDYEKDHTKPYTTILGCRVAGPDNLPDGMVSKTIPEGVYTKQVARGDIMAGAVFNEWQKIWNTDLPRNFIADFEIYGERSQLGDKSEVDIFVGLHQ